MKQNCSRTYFFSIILFLFFLVFKRYTIILSNLYLGISRDYHHSNNRLWNLCIYNQSLRPLYHILIVLLVQTLFDSI